LRAAGRPVAYPRVPRQRLELCSPD